MFLKHQEHKDRQEIIEKNLVRLVNLVLKINMSAKVAKSLLVQGMDTVLPPRCVVSGELVDRQGMIAPEIWADMDFITDPQCKKCGIPFEFEADEGTECALCLDRPPPYTSARSALKYNDASRDLILGFKHADQTHAVVAFMPWLEKAGANMLESADYIVPVPLHRWRLLMRRYNQAAIMAHSLSVVSKVPTLVDALRRIRSTKSQGHLKPRERHKNVKRAFEIAPKDIEKLKGKTIILIDDVYTTGATVKECTKVLLKAGVKDVHILTLARVVRDEFFE